MKKLLGILVIGFCRITR